LYIGGAFREPDNDPKFVGHELTVIIRTEYVPTDGNVGGDCTMNWYEKTNLPYPTGTDWDGSWRDMYANPTWLSGTLGPWTLREKGCFANGKIIIKDRPGFDLPRPHETGKRYLCIRVVVRKAPGCDCASDEEEFTYRQDIEFVNGVPSPPKGLIPAQGDECKYPS
jgi:hypothetical protein